MSSDPALAQVPAQVPAPRPAVPAIEVEDLSISFRIRLGGSSTLSDLRRLVRRRRAPDRMVPALREVSFDVAKGSVLAVIGRNGAGKTTLLRAIAGVLAPEQGRIVVRGQISNLSAVGVGFDQNLTGRQNIRLGGLALGMSEGQLAELTDTIAEFAQLDEYIDYPIRAYSTGMRGRLAVSLAAHLDPEILLLDEALGGGDAAFAEHIKERLAQLCGEGRTVVLVTHGLSAVRTMATEALWLHQGRVVEAGDPDDVVAKYMRYCRIEHLELFDPM